MEKLKVMTIVGTRPEIYSIARIAADSWGMIQTKNVRLLRASGVAFTKRVISESELAHLIKRSGILAYALGGYKTLYKNRNLTKYLEFKKIILMIFRELWYFMPDKIRVGLNFLLSTK